MDENEHHDFYSNGPLPPVPETTAPASGQPWEITPPPPPPVQPIQPGVPQYQPPQPTAAAPVKTDEPHPMVVMQPGEKVVCTLKRHPFGIVGTYFSGGAIVLVAAAVAVFGVPHLAANATNSSQLELLAYAVLLLILVAVAGVMGISTKVYWKNQWIVTSDSITQISQTSLFGSQSAQLSMESLEDVTVDQNGMLQHMFGYGTLHVETAGEHSKFVFPYCPDPTRYAHLILEAREAYLAHKQYEN